MTAYTAVQVGIENFSGVAWGWSLFRFRRRESDGVLRPRPGRQEGQPAEALFADTRPRPADIMENRTDNLLMRNDPRFSIIHLMTSTLTCIQLSIDDRPYKSMA